MVKCINTFSVEIIKLGKRNKFIFTKGEYYFIDENVGGVWIKHDSGEWFDWHDEKYINTFERSFINS
jgi:hypothetical protein